MSESRCPDCSGELEFLNEAGTFGLGDMICSTDVLICPNRHVWLRAHRPELLGEDKP